MNRTTNVLGFSFLAVAATLAAMITMRNSSSAPAAKSSATLRDAGNVRNRAGIPVRETSVETPAREEPNQFTKDASRPLERTADHAGDVLDPESPVAVGRRPDRSPGSAGRTRIHEQRKDGSGSFEVTVPAEMLTDLSAEKRLEWQNRVDFVSRSASAQLGKMTEELDLTPSQRAKLFPTLVRAIPGYDAAMTVGGSALPGESTMTPDEEVHAVLNPEQQVEVEDNVVDRQLWWQNIIDRLEADLTNSTGGGVITSDGEVIPPGESPDPVDESRDAPDPREDMNLFDMMETSE